MAEITDYFGKVSVDDDHSVATTVAADREAGVTVLSGFDLSTFTEDTPVFFITYTKTTDPLTGEVTITDLTSWKGLVNSGASTITNMTIAPGYTDEGNTEGQFIECIPTSYWGNQLVDGIQQEHNPDGTHSDVTATSVSTDTISEKTAAAGVTIDGLQVKDSKLVTSDSVVTANITAAAVTPDKLGTGADMAYVATSETTTSTSLTNLTTTTDSVTVTVGANGLALVSVSSYMQNNTANALCKIAIDVSGATTIAASDAYAIQTQFYAANASSRSSGCWLFTGLTPGSTTFKMKYSVTSGGSGSGTGTFANRRIAAVPL